MCMKQNWKLEHDYEGNDWGFQDRNGSRIWRRGRLGSRTCITAFSFSCRVRPDAMALVLVLQQLPKGAER